MADKDLFSGMYEWAQSKGKNKAFIIANKEMIQKMLESFSIMEIWRYLHDEQKVIKQAYSTFHRLVNKHVLETKKGVKPPGVGSREQPKPETHVSSPPHNIDPSPKSDGPLRIAARSTARLKTTATDTFNSKINPENMFVRKAETNVENQD